MNAFIATPAAYAPPTESAETRRPGYAATSTPRQASARNDERQELEDERRQEEAPVELAEPVGRRFECVAERSEDVHARGHAAAR